MKIIILAAPLILAGCISSEITSSNQKVIVVKADTKNSAEAQSMADIECSKYGRYAWLNKFIAANKVWGNYFFDCKEPAEQ